MIIPMSVSLFRVTFKIKVEISDGNYHQRNVIAGVLQTQQKFFCKKTREAFELERNHRKSLIISDQWLSAT